MNNLRLGAPNEKNVQGHIPQANTFRYITLMVPEACQIIGLVYSSARYWRAADHSGGVIYK